MNTARSVADIKEDVKKSLLSVPGMPEVEVLIQQKFSSDAARLSEVSDYLFSLGGKRVRPALVLEVARTLGCTPPTPEHIEVAAGIELIHMATLLHDDIIDDATLRRHQTSPFMKFGRDDSLLAGDFLLVRAFSLCARLNAFIIAETEQACVELTEGEILEKPLFTREFSLEDYLQIIQKKTASLFRLSCVCGAQLSGASEQLVQELGLFGEKLGMGFQVLDDILDITADADLLGKATGTDLREKKPSIINVLWLAREPERAAFLKDRDNPIDARVVEESVSYLRRSAILEEAREIALALGEEAKQSLRRIEQLAPECDWSRLEGLLQFSLRRLY